MEPIARGSICVAFSKVKHAHENHFICAEWRPLTYIKHSFSHSCKQSLLDLS